MIIAGSYGMSVPLFETSDDSIGKPGYKFRRLEPNMEIMIIDFSGILSQGLRITPP